jgi:hypothetical protein
MDDQKQKTEHGPSPSTGARIEEDIVRPLKRIVGSSRHRLPVVLTGGPFSYYKLVYEPTASGKDPSYPGGSSYWAVPPVGAGSSAPITIDPGDYKVRVQAIGYPNGAYAYAQTTVLLLTVPAPTPAPTPTPTPTP